MTLFLDTNVLPRSGQVRNPLISTTLRIARSLGMTVALPDIVIEESVNQRYQHADDAVRRLQQAYRDLRQVYDAVTMYTPSPEEVAETWRADLAAAFYVVKSHPDDAKEGLIREAHRRKPAKQGGTGARDVAIWLSVARWHRESASDPTYFVSMNTADFAGTDKATLHPDLLADLDGGKNEFRYFAGLDQFIAMHAETFSYEPSDDSLAAQQAELVDQLLSDHRVADDFLVSEWQAHGRLVEYRIDAVRTLKAYKIDGEHLALIELRGVLMSEGEHPADEARQMSTRWWVDLGGVHGPIDTIELDHVNLV